MQQREVKRTRQDAKGYMTNLSNAQVLGVIESETQRIKDHNNEGDIAETARIMLRAAQREASKRGI